MEFSYISIVIEEKLARALSFAFSPYSGILCFYKKKLQSPLQYSENHTYSLRHRYTFLCHVFDDFSIHLHRYHCLDTYMFHDLHEYFHSIHRHTSIHQDSRKCLCRAVCSFDIHLRFASQIKFTRLIQHN